jgi:hypothetical protein
MTDSGERFVVTVSDHAPTAPARRGTAPASDGGSREGVGYDGAGYDGGSAIPAGFGLAVISGLADDVRVSSTSSGVSIRMSWPSTAATS